MCDAAPIKAFMQGQGVKMGACLAHRHLGQPVRTAARREAAAVAFVHTRALLRLPLHVLLKLVWC